MVQCHDVCKRLNGCCVNRRLDVGSCSFVLHLGRVQHSNLNSRGEGIHCGPAWQKSSGAIWWMCTPLEKLVALRAPLLDALYNQIETGVGYLLFRKSFRSTRYRTAELDELAGRGPSASEGQCKGRFLPFCRRHVARETAYWFN